MLLDEQDARAALVREPADDRQQPLDDDRREPQAELVEQEQPRPPRERARHRQHLLLAAREQPGAPVAQCVERREVLERGRRVEPLQPEVLGDGQAEEDPAALEHVRQAAPRQSVGRDTRDVGAVEPHAAAHRPHEPRDDAQRRRLAGAVRSEQRDHPALLDRQCDVTYHRSAVVAGRQLLALEDRAHVVLAPASGAAAASGAATAAAAAFPRYASTTRGSRRTSSGGPFAITLPKSSTTTWSH